MSHLVIGPGYLGLRVAKLWQATGKQVSLVSRTSQHAKEILDSVYSSIVADVTKPKELTTLPTAKVVLYAVGRERDSNQTPHQVYSEGFGNVLDALQKSASTNVRVLLISTTGVYADADGGWVNEASIASPTRPSARALFEAEQRLRASRFAENAVILRLAGIYGPGRIPRFIGISDIGKSSRTLVPSKTPSSTSSNHWLNLIHVTDAAIALAAAATAPPGTYNVSDGHPVRRADFDALSKELFSVARSSSSAESQVDQYPGRKQASVNKRISNDRMRSGFATMLQYPSYREGLMSIANTISPKGQAID